MSIGSKVLLKVEKQVASFGVCFHHDNCSHERQNELNSPRVNLPKILLASLEMVVKNR